MTNFGDEQSTTADLAADESADTLFDASATIAAEPLDVTQAVPSQAQTAAALTAYSQEPDTVEWADANGAGGPVPAAESRRRAIALTAVILFVTAGIATAILWFGHPGNRDRSLPSAAPVVAATESAPAVTPGPLNGVYRLDRYTAQSVGRDQTGVFGSPPDLNEVVTWWIALRSECDQSGCTASGVQLDNDLHQRIAKDLDDDLGSRARSRPMHFRQVNGEWRTDPPIVSHARCERGSAAAETWHDVYVLMLLPDGTLKGEATGTVVSNECGAEGTVITTPVSATRTGDVPPTVAWNE